MSKKKRADPLRQENYGLPIGHILERSRDIKPIPKRYIDLIRPMCGHYEYKYEFVKSHGDNVSPNLKLRRGDIAYVRPTSSAPKFMYNTYVVVLDRYRIVKYKDSTYHDYGVVLMVITGSNKGRVGKAYGCLGSISNTMINNLEEV